MPSEDPNFNEPIQPPRDKYSDFKSERATPRTRVALISSAALASIIGIALYVHSPSQPAPVVAWPKLTRVWPTPAEKAEAMQEDAQPPLRVKNPFDASEVFEFPAGTTKEEARSAIADILLKRAQERQQLYPRKSLASSIT